MIDIMRAREPVTKTQKHVFSNNIAEIDILIHAPGGWWGKDSKTMFFEFFDTWHKKYWVYYLPIILCDFFHMAIDEIMSHRIKQVHFNWLYSILKLSCSK